MSRVRIVSAGNGPTTHVYVDGVLLTNVVAVSWECSARGFASCVLDLDDVEIDATAEITPDFQAS